MGSLTVGNAIQMCGRSLSIADTKSMCEDDYALQVG